MMGVVNSKFELTTPYFLRKEILYFAKMRYVNRCHKGIRQREYCKTSQSKANCCLCKNEMSAGMD